MKSLAEIKNKDGIALKAFTDALVQRCRDLNLICVILVSTLDEVPGTTLTAHNLHDKDLPGSLRQFANIVESQPSGHSAITLTDAEPS